MALGVGFTGSHGFVISVSALLLVAVLLAARATAMRLANRSRSQRARENSR